MIPYKIKTIVPAVVVLAWIALAQPMSVKANAETPTNLPSASEYLQGWQIKEAPFRAVFRSDDKRQATVELPAKGPDGTPLHGVAAFANDSPLPAKPIAWNEKALTVIVDTSSVDTKGTEISLYALPSPSSEGPGFTDDDFVHFRITQTGVFEAPPMVDDMLAMARCRPRNKVFEFDVPSVGYIKSGKNGKKNNWYRWGWQNYTYLAEYSGLLNVPESGDYQFFVAERASGPVYLFIGDQVVINHPHRGMPPTADRPKRTQNQPGRNGGSIPAPAPALGAWIPGEKLHLDKGVVAYRVLTFAKRFCEVTLGWIPPSANAESEPEEIPEDAWAASFPPRAARIDRRDEPRLSTASDLTTEEELSYQFENNGTIFLPISFQSLHPRISPTGSQAYSPACTWTLLGEEGAPSQSFDGDDREAIATKASRHAGNPRLRLLVQDTATRSSVRAETEIRFPERAALLYRVSAKLNGVPPFCYGEDTLQPELVIRTTLPEGKTFLLRATLHHRLPGREPISMEKEVVPSENWGRLPLPACRVADLSFIEWEVLHAGRVLASGKTNFEHAPFKHAPDDSLSDFLLYGGSPISFVPRRTRAGASSHCITLPQQAKIALLDGFAAPMGGFGKDALDRFSNALGGTASIQRYTIGGFLQDKGLATSRRGLALAASLSTIGKPDLLVLAPDFSEIANGAPIEEFERHLAALTGLACEALDIPTILMTPPPGLLASASLETTPAMRPFAEAVYRVADAYGVPVADLYSLCRTRNATATAPNGSLTEEGAELAGKAVAIRLKR